jgi:hypothetical protein
MRGEKSLQSGTRSASSLRLDRNFWQGRKLNNQPKASLDLLNRPQREQLLLDFSETFLRFFHNP